MGQSSQSKQAESTNLQVQQEQANILQEQTQQSAADKARMTALQAPEISFLQSIIGGDKSAEVSAAAPQIAELSSGFNASKEQIMNSIPPGPARDLALSQLDIQKNVGISTTMSNLAGTARDKLANIGAGLGSFSLQELGAGLAGGAGAATTGGGIIQAEDAKKASTMQFLGSLIGAGAQLGSAAVTSPYTLGSIFA